MKTTHGVLFFQMEGCEITQICCNYYRTHIGKLKIISKIEKDNLRIDKIQALKN